MIGASPTLTVSDFVAVFNQSLDMLYPEVVIRGELANYRISKGMWVYYDLKDDEASVKFFGTVRSLPGPLEEGMMLEVRGRPYLHPKFGFSVQFDAVQAVGEGAINKAQLLLAKKLKSEGLFDESRKRSLPYPPQKVAVISSSESAGYGDFIKVTTIRWPMLEIQLFDVQVQGVDAPAQIVSAFEKVNQSNDIDVVVLIRGGGSKDDLLAFDHENVVRAVAGSRVPTLVAIGHERDNSLSEMVADVRASTPSNASELLVPSRKDEQEWLNSVRRQLEQALTKFVDTMKQEIKMYGVELERSFLSTLELSEYHLQQSAKLLGAYSPYAPLKRGFALIRDTSGAIITSSAVATEAKVLELEFHDGKVDVKLNHKEQ